MTTSPNSEDAKAPTPSDREWSDRCADLFEDLRRPARAMVARAYGKSLSDEEIQDVYAAAWTATLSALRKRGRDMSEPELRAYVLTAVASHASKELRRRARKPTGPLDELHGSALADRHDPSPDERVIGSESQSVARDLLSSLPARRRAVMLLRYGWGLSPDEVCALVTGLSRRAYRKEINRGVEQLIERLGEVESGDWCRSREPMLRDYLAGTADEAERLQVEQHLRHCRACSRLTAQIRNEFNDLGGVVALGSVAGVLAGVRPSVFERFSGFFQGTRDSAHAMADKAELTAGTLSTSGGVKGAGAAGAGIAAKFGAFGGAGKAAIACLGAGAAATACVATGVVPGIGIDGFKTGRESVPKEVRVAEREEPAEVPPAAPVGPPAPEPTPPVSAPEPEPPAQQPEPDKPEQEVEQEPVVTPTEEFDPVPQATPPPAPPSSESGGSSPVPSPSSGGGGSIAGEEFGP